jgi:hypothetical protein
MAFPHDPLSFFPSIKHHHNIQMFVWEIVLKTVGSNGKRANSNCLDCYMLIWRWRRDQTRHLSIGDGLGKIII